MAKTLADITQCQNVSSSIDTLQKMAASIAETISRLLEGIKSLTK